MVESVVDVFLGFLVRFGGGRERFTEERCRGKCLVRVRGSEGGRERVNK